MTNLKNDTAAPATWKRFLLVGLEFLVTFYVITLSMVIYIIHRGDTGFAPIVLLGILYVFIFVVAASRLIRRLPIEALMLAAPTIPLLMLILVLSLIPVLQLFS